MSEDFIFRTNHKVVESKESGINAIQLLDPPYNGIIFSYGKVEFPEDKMDDETCTLSFEYDIIEDNGKAFDIEEFEKYLGDFLVELIMYGLTKNEIVYTGGENSEIGTDDTEQSDT